MNVKQCSKCGEEKPLRDFHKHKRGKHGVDSRCKKCTKEYQQENKERLKNYYKHRYQENKERINDYQKQYNEENKERRKQYRKQYYQENKERTKQYQKQYYQENKERTNERRKQYYQENKERIKQYQKQYRQDNKEHLAKCRNQNRKQRRQSEPMFKLKDNLRGRTSRAFRGKGYLKNSKTKELLGVEWEILKKHIERQFTKGMNWDNYGEWHVDHIIPLSSAKTEEEVIKLCHYSNLQPLWAKDNFSKNDKIEPTQVKLRI